MFSFKEFSNYGGQQLGKWSSIIAISALGLAATSNAYAEEAHAHSDVEFGFIGSVIEIEPSAEGGYVFEADFFEESPFTETDDPGFNNEEFVEAGSGGALQGSFVGFNVFGPLVFWDGDSFESVGSATLSIGDVIPETSVISGSTVSDLASFALGSQKNIIGQADFQGEIHSHLDFELFNGVTGAYGILMSLSTDEAGIADSRTFGIFFNNGLGDEAFEAGVDAFNAQVVPIPAGVWLFASAIGLLLPRARKQS